MDKKMDKKEETTQKMTPYQVQSTRISKVIEKRVKENRILFKRDWLHAITAALEQLPDDEIKEARGLRIKYVISGGKIRRESTVWVQTMNQGMDPVFVEEAVFGGWYEDMYSAFGLFIHGLKSSNFRFKKPSIPPRFSKEAEIEIEIYFDPA